MSDPSPARTMTMLTIRMVARLKAKVLSIRRENSPHPLSYPHEENERRWDQVSSLLRHVRVPVTGSTGRPKEHQHSAAAGRDAGPTVPAKVPDRKR